MKCGDMIALETAQGGYLAHSNAFDIVLATIA
jgi:hypothetical protein